MYYITITQEYVFHHLIIILNVHIPYTVYTIIIQFSIWFWKRNRLRASSTSAAPFLQRLAAIHFLDSDGGLVNGITKNLDVSE